MTTGRGGRRPGSGAYFHGHEITHRARGDVGPARGSETLRPAARCALVTPWPHTGVGSCNHRNRTAWSWSRLYTDPRPRRPLGVRPDLRRRCVPIPDEQSRSEVVTGARTKRSDPAGTPALSLRVPGTIGWWLPQPWWWLSVSVAVPAAAASAAGLLAADRIYGRETPGLFDAAIAQDVVTLLSVAPLLALLAVSARRGSLCAFLCLPGCLAFTAYNYAIYAFSIHFGPLVLVWVAALGTSIFALVDVLATADLPAIKQRFAERAMPGPAWFLIGLAALFVLLWLSEVVPNLLAGALVFRGFC